MTSVSFRVVWAAVATEMQYIRKTAGYTWIDFKTNAETAKERNITPVLNKIQEYRRICLQHTRINRMPRNRLPRIIKKLQIKKQKEPGKTFKETSGCMRPERVNQWPNSMLARLLLLLLLL